ncbi:MAG: hypothetical protein WDN31_17595 [Hyphomicrobium sp.]
MRGERGPARRRDDAGPDRVAPVCRHFTHCGGLRRAAPARARLPRLEAGDGRCRLCCARHRCTGRTRRRRRTWGAAAGGRSRARADGARGVVLGFHEAKGVEIVDLKECPVTASAIVKALPDCAASPSR